MQIMLIWPTIKYLHAECKRDQIEYIYNYVFLSLLTILCHVKICVVDPFLMVSLDSVILTDYLQQNPTPAENLRTKTLF